MDKDEFNQALCVIQVAAQLIRKLSDDPQIQEWADDINNAVNKILNAQLN